MACRPQHHALSLTAPGFHQAATQAARLSQWCCQWCCFHTFLQPGASDISSTYWLWWCGSHSMTCMNGCNCGPGPSAHSTPFLDLASHETKCKAGLGVQQQLTQAAPYCSQCRMASSDPVSRLSARTAKTRFCRCYMNMAAVLSSIYQQLTDARYDVMRPMGR